MKPGVGPCSLRVRASRLAAPATDGAHLVVGHEGINLLPLDAGPGTVVVTFIRRGEVIRGVTLAQVLRDLSSLERTASQPPLGPLPGLRRPGALRDRDRRGPPPRLRGDRRAPDDLKGLAVRLLEENAALQAPQSHSSIESGCRHAYATSVCLPRN